MSSHAGTIDHHHDPSTSTGIPNKKLLMWTFLASDCMFFGALIATHLIYRLHPPPGAPNAKEVFSIELTSFSTFILLMSSLMMALAVNAIQKGNVKNTRWSLLTTIFFGCIFLGCQVYEFEHFVHEKHLTLSNSILGSTFFTLTGTHGCHVAIGVLWLTLMYVRSFKPAGESRPWFGQNLVHVLCMIAAILFTGKLILDLTHVIQTDGFGGHAIGDFMKEDFLFVVLAAVAYAALVWFAKPRGEVDFDQRHAIDVEGMGLYWHFVDIVWIVIFTAVYLLEYI